MSNKKSKRVIVKHGYVPPGMQPRKPNSGYVPPQMPAPPKPTGSGKNQNKVDSPKSDGK